MSEIPKGRVEKQQPRGPLAALIIGGGLIAAATIAFAFMCLRSPEMPGYAGVGQVVLLGIAAIVAAVYAYQTWRMANEAFEARKLAARPYVRLKQVVAEKEKPDVHVYAYNEGPHLAWEVAILWEGEGAGCQDTAGELMPHEESERFSPPCQCEHAVLTYESMMGQKCKRRYDKTPSGWWRPELRRSHGS